MNKVWSEEIQGINTLDLSRELRFRDDRKDLFLTLLGITSELTVVDIGCGPGTLTRKLSKWLGPNATIIGIDRDINFINYAREKADKHHENITYIEGDALNLPLKDNSVDASVSHTVIEHVPNKEFLLEQKRICRPGGRVSVMFARPDKYIRTESVETPQLTKRETELMTKLFSHNSSDVDRKYNIGTYWPDSIELPKLFEKLGFKQVFVDAIAVPIAIDDSRLIEHEKIVMVENEKRQLLETIHLELNSYKTLTVAEAKDLKRLIDERFNKRIKQIQNGFKLWDYTITLTQIVSGIV
ncbi:class I SAM-dependent methyltransferase [Haloplasma contractile]|uniref:SAM-dependent methyltransferase in polysaccharide biosynthesis locu protein n=1 Tax=Haloplasma contractile SSD-17B TaxID=1033810 RepID=U2FJW8_9MOLU|nr:class I SAM-dependent methyltransferase [Haloplasma contractile]ERJ11524.1 SAM-dependent methyltransferase in polysaccharide biosynthesis locu protein [Haloplasma contractile SSD-17B]